MALPPHLSEEVLVDWNKDKPDIKDIHKGETGLLIANGPSLEQIPLEFLQRFPSFGMNNIYLYGMTDEEVAGYPKEHQDIKFVPDYYVILGLDQVNTPEDRSYFMPLLDRVKYAFVNRLAMKFLSYDNVYAIHSWSVKRRAKQHNSRLFSYDPLDYCGLGFSNAYVALQLMYYMGFSKVYCVGLDNDYGRSEDKRHFYPDDPRFSCEPSEGRYAASVGSYYVFGLAREAFEAEGREIININDVNNTPFDSIGLEEIESIKKSVTLEVN